MASATLAPRASAPELKTVSPDWHRLWSQPQTAGRQAGLSSELETLPTSNFPLSLQPTTHSSATHWLRRWPPTPGLPPFAGREESRAAGAAADEYERLVDAAAVLAAAAVASRASTATASLLAMLMRSSASCTGGGRTGWREAAEVSQSNVRLHADDSAKGHASSVQGQGVRRRLQSSIHGGKSIEMAS